MNNPHAERDLDTTNAGRGVWLVKIPKYMREKWAEVNATIDVGKLQIQKVPGKLPTVTFSLAESLLKDEKLPRKHHFILHSVKEQTLGVFSQTVPSSSSSGSDSSEAEKLFLEGHVIQKFECQPVVDAAYLNLKRAAVKKAEKPDRQATFIERPVHVYKPIARHQAQVVRDQQKKSEGKKARDDKGKVTDMLFSAFEKHQYYNIKDLQKLTRQPITYLKEILQEYCDYNVKNPHKSMWELKPEYRHYKKDAVKDENTSNETTNEEDQTSE